MAILAVGTPVQTPYGPGQVLSYRKEDDIYQLTLNWTLSDGQKVYVFSQASQFKVVEPQTEEVKAEAAVAVEPAVAVTAEVEAAPVEEKKLAVGIEVKFAYGVGKIVAIREEDNMYHVEFSNWTLTDGQKVHLFCQASQLSFATAEDSAAVQTDAVAVEAEPEVEAPKVCKTAYGEGHIIAYRPDDDIFKIELTSWVLSGGQKVYIYCQSSQFTTVSPTVVKVPANNKAQKEKGCCTIM